MVTDLSKSSIEQLLDLIRSENDLDTLQLDVNDVSLGSIEVLTDHQSGKNTAAVVSSKPNTRYVGSVPIVYNRLPLSGLIQYGDLTIVVAEESSDLDILNALNSAYGTNISFDEITISNSELVDYDGGEVTFSANLSSVVWTDEITLLVKVNQAQLSTILVNNELDGLNWPIVQVVQQITFNNPGNQNFGTSLNVTATSDSGLTPVITSLTPTVCTIDEDGDVNFLRTGTCSLAANQEGNEYYYPADQVIRNFSILAVVPTVPRNVIASPITEGASVAFTPPISLGGSAIISYTVLSNPDNVIVSGSGSPIFVEGLSPTKQYTFTVYATNGAGDSDESSPSNEITPYEPAPDTLNGDVQSLIDIEGSGYGGSGGVIDGILYFTMGATSSGGVSFSTTTRILRRYDIATNTWLSNGPLLPVEVRDMVPVVHDGILYLYGGSSTNINAGTNTHYSYSPVTNTWTALANIPASVLKPAVAAIGNYIYVYGGLGSGSSGRALYRYDIAGNSWTTLAASPSSPSSGARKYGMIHKNGKLYTYGITARTHVFIYDIAENTWTSQEVTDTTGAIHSSFGVGIVYNDVFYMFNTNMVTYLDLQDFTIKRIGTVSFGSQLIVAAHENGIYVASGSDDPNGLRLLT